MMQTHTFTLVLAGTEDVVGDMSQQTFLEMSDVLFAAGCDDASPGIRNGLVYVNFDRESSDLQSAIHSAIADVRRAGYRVARVEPEDREVFDRINAELAGRA